MYGAFTGQETRVSVDVDAFRNAVQQLTTRLLIQMARATTDLEPRWIEVHHGETSDLRLSHAHLIKLELEGPGAYVSIAVLLVEHGNETLVFVLDPDGRGGWAARQMVYHGPPRYEWLWHDPFESGIPRHLV